MWLSGLFGCVCTRHVVWHVLCVLCILKSGNWLSFPMPLVKLQVMVVCSFILRHILSAFPFLPSSSSSLSLSPLCCLLSPLFPYNPFFSLPPSSLLVLLATTDVDALALNSLIHWSLQNGDSLIL